ncbi:PAS domain-containing protein [Phormidium sp. LEGE 05292]|uniref:PAS domain-containing protein n=1 Tax=[Phormidium] sp. LEGE 05292 TaxID=767427 RepID=UPI00188171D2|nr:PAS domain-containing protein [Phormidium sp. LEGE 05292]MBE9225145.1 PAS domain-containing protein [Phormidium sp. LEGE 05292]
MKMLLIEDNLDDVELIRKILLETYTETSLNFTNVDCLQAGIQVLSETKFDVVLLDLTLPDSQGLETIIHVKNYVAKTPIVVMLTSNDQKLALSAIHGGAQFYLVKSSIDSQILLNGLEYAVERQRTENEVHLLLEATTAISQSQDHNEALAVTLDLLCKHINWDFGEAWIANDYQKLNYSPGWYIGDRRLEEFVEHSQNLKLLPGEGLPGRVFLSGKPEWIEDLYSIEKSSFLRLEITAKLGLKSCFAVPIIGDTKVLAVLVFFKKEKTGEDQHLLELLNAVATQLGSHIQRKKIADALQLSEERLHLAIAASNLGLWDWNIRTEEVYFNSYWKQMLGYKETEIENNFTNWEQLIHPEDLPRVLQILNDNLEGSTDCYAVEFRMQTKSGEWKWIFSQGKVVLRDELGKPLRMTGTHQDISDRKKAEEANSELTRKFQESQKIAHIGNWEFDVLAGTITWSDELSRILGVTSNKIASFDELIELIHPEDREAFLNVVETALTEGTPYEIDHRIIRPDGVIRYLNSKGKALRANHKPQHRNKFGYVLRLFGISIDITERYQAEAALQQQFLRQRLLAAIMERIRQSLNSEEILQTAVEEVRRFLLTDRVIIYRFNPDWSGITVVESVGEEWMPILGLAIQDNCFVEKYVPLYQLGRIRAIEDIYNGELYSCHADTLAKFQVKANIVLPILQGEKLWGLLIIHHCKSMRKWQDSEIDCLKQITVQLGIAIQQSTLFEQAQIEIVERQKAELALRESEAKLQEKNQELEITLKDLKQTQSQLIQSEKMVSLGQMVAGIAHEINNPISFIYGNLNYANQYVQHLFKLVQLYGSYYPNPPDEIQQQIAENDLEFIMEDFPKLLISMQSGAERIEKIVKSLRTFSRLDEADMKSVDIHEGIESTLMLLQSRLNCPEKKLKIQVIKYYSELPLVECYAGQLNQVIMNLLYNAIEALEEKQKKLSIKENSPDLSTITIRTYLSALGYVAISIADNGCGIPESIRKRVFDPFFTTKPVGQGTGLGLSVSHSIIKHHGGQIICKSTFGKGTEFIIEIPLTQCSSMVQMPLQQQENPNHLSIVKYQ